MIIIEKYIIPFLKKLSIKFIFDNMQPLCLLQVIFIQYVIPMFKK